jgi:hypothetical protein
MVAVPTWLRGRDIGSIVLTGQTVDAAGTLADGVSPAAQTITGSLRAVRFNSNPEKSDVSPITATVTNKVIEAEDNTFEFEILLNGSGVINSLATLCATYDIIKAVIVRKRSGATTTPTSGQWTFYGSRGPTGEAIESRGANMCTLTLEQVDIASANPAYA